MPVPPSREEFDRLLESFDAMRKGVESVLNIAASAQAEIRVLALICGHTIARSCSLAADPEEAFQHIVEGTEDAVTAGMKLDPASADSATINEIMKMIRACALYELSVLLRGSKDRP